MAKELTAKIKLQCPAGQATPAPPVGPALGAHGLNIADFVKQFNVRGANRLEGFSSQGLDALCTAPTHDPVPPDYPEGGYLDSLEVPKDPWKRDYVYFMPGRSGKPFEVITYGRDGEPGGEDQDEDISSLEL